MVVMPISCCNPRMRSRISKRRCASRFESGSSSSSTLGLMMSARASATRCCWPPESSRGRRAPRSGSRTRSRHLPDAPRDLVPGHLTHLEAEPDVVGHAHVGKQQVVSGNTITTPRFSGLSLSTERPSKRDIAGSRRKQSRDHLHRGGLAASGRPEQRRQLPALDIQGQLGRPTVNPLPGRPSSTP